MLMMSMTMTVIMMTMAMTDSDDDDDVDDGDDNDSDNDDDGDDNDDVMLMMSGSDVFLDSSIHCYLSELLRVYCKPSYLDRMDFTQPVPGLASFHDLYDSQCCYYFSIHCCRIHTHTRSIFVAW